VAEGQKGARFITEVKDLDTVSKALKAAGWTIVSSELRYLAKTFPDLDAGATGSMTGGGYPDGIRQIFDAYQAGRREEAAAAYQRWLPLINYENRQCGLLAAKILMKEGGVIASEAARHPILPVHPVIRAGLIEVAQRLDPMVLGWGR